MRNSASTKNKTHKNKKKGLANLPPETTSNEVVFFYGSSIKLGSMRGVFRYRYSFCVSYLAINSSKSTRM